MIAKDGRISLAPDVMFAVLEGEAVLLDLRSGLYFALNPTATRIWQLLSEKGTLSEVRSAMLQQFAVSDDVLDKDIDDLMTSLSEKGLIRIDAV